MYPAPYTKYDYHYHNWYVVWGPLASHSILYLRVSQIHVKEQATEHHSIS